jgi:flagella synthesis protein FlgN
VKGAAASASGSASAAVRASTPSARQQAMLALLRGVADDVAAYTSLLDMLEQQFDAIVRHQTERLTQLGAIILPTIEAMETRRQERVSLVATLLGPEAGMAQVFPLLKGATRQMLEEHWLSLEKMVSECKRRNIRNSELLTEQYSIMQRVLHGEEQLYAPI